MTGLEHLDPSDRDSDDRRSAASQPRQPSSRGFHQSGWTSRDGHIDTLAQKGEHGLVLFGKVWSAT
jgi:hypothetical protein